MQQMSKDAFVLWVLWALWMDASTRISIYEKRVCRCHDQRNKRAGVYGIVWALLKECVDTVSISQECVCARRMIVCGHCNAVARDDWLSGMREGYHDACMFVSVSLAKTMRPVGPSNLHRKNNRLPLPQTTCSGVSNEKKQMRRIVKQRGELRG